MTDDALVDAADRVDRELTDAEPVCECDICTDPERGLCPGGTDTLVGRLEWAMNELTDAVEDQP